MCKRAGIFLTLLIACRYVSAGDAGDRLFDPEQPLTAEILIAAVMARNPGLLAEQADIDESSARVLPARRLDDPEISFSFAPETFDGIEGTDRGFNQRVEIEQALPWPGTLALRENIAQQAARVQHAQFSDKALELRAEASKAYALWEHSHEALGLNAEQQDLLNRLKSVGETRYAAGLAGQQEALEAEQERLKLEVQALALRRGQRELRARLNALLNRPAQSSIPPPAAHDPQLVDPDRLPTTADAHPVLRALKAELEGGGAEVDLARKESLPEFKLMSAYDSFWDQDEQRFMVGASFNVPWDRGKYRALVDAAQAAKNSKRWMLIDRTARLEAELESARAMAAESYQAIALYRDGLVPLATDAARVAVSEYESGGGSFANLIATQRAKLEAQLKLAELEAEYWSRMAEFERWSASDLSFAAKGAAGE
jgi:outer membrane protein, heavy metal efflux system